jgi:hypothetical protein
VFKDGFDKIRAASLMTIWSLKTAAHFDELDGKSFMFNFCGIMKVLIDKRTAKIAIRSLSRFDHFAQDNR